MSLSNLDKNTTNRLFEMLSINDIVKSDELTKIKNDNVTYSQLLLINKQIENLKIEAMDILNNHIKTQEINNIICNFNKVPGTLYYLYSDNNNKKIISLVSPDFDQHGNITNIIYNRYLGKYFYDFDLKFKKMD